MCPARFTICAVLVFLFTFAASSYAGYSGGTGEPNTPFEIATVADWQELMATPADWASHFVLTAHIDLNDVTLIPVGNDANNFTGVFDGNDYVIRNADVNMPDSNYVGLFGYLGTDGRVKNLGGKDISVSGRDRVGGLVGCSYYGSISNSYSTGSVGGSVSVGGLVGGNYYCDIISCYSGGSVNGNKNVGGLVGYNNSYYNYDYGIISNCYSNAAVSGSSRVGGLVAVNWGTILNCYSNGLINGEDNVGGLVGSHSGSIASSFWDVNTSGLTTSAGGTGKTTAQMQDVNTFLGAGWDFVGETANGTCNFWLMPDAGGYPVLSIFNGYIPAEPSGSGTEAHPYIITDANGLGTVWYRPSAHYLVANDIDLAGMNWNTPIVPFLSGVFDGNDHALHSVDVNVPASDYVGLFGYLAIDAQVKNLAIEDISIFGRDYVGGLVGFSYHSSVNNCCSSGSVTGVDYVGGIVGWNEYGIISNSCSSGSVSGEDGVGGLVGEQRYGTISNCCSIGSFRGSGIFVGGVVGYNHYTSISNCYSTGSVSGIANVGGLVGLNRENSPTSNCYSTGPVSGTQYVGGLVGANGGPITKCYSTGPVSSAGEVGGLAGRNDGPIRDCYSRSSVSSTGSPVGGLVGYHYSGSVSNCYSTGLVSGTGDYVGGLLGRNRRGATDSGSFWDVKTSRRATSAGGTPKTTAEMKTQSTFTSAAWDFIGETGNGTEDIWASCEGTNYPRLVWQIRAADWICPDGVGLEDFSYLGGAWGTADPSPANLDGEDGIGFGDLMIFCEEWLSGR